MGRTVERKLDEWEVFSGQKTKYRDVNPSKLRIFCSYHVAHFLELR